MVDLLKVEESDEALETEEELKVEAKVKNKVTKVEFELEFAASSDNRGEIISAITEKLSTLTAEQISNALDLEDDKEDDEEDNEDED